MSCFTFCNSIYSHEEEKKQLLPMFIAEAEKLVFDSRFASTLLPCFIYYQWLLLVCITAGFRVIPKLHLYKMSMSANVLMFAMKV